jgi:hypothetical protein
VLVAFGTICAPCESNLRIHAHTWRMSKHQQIITNTFKTHQRARRFSSTHLLGCNVCVFTCAFLLTLTCTTQVYPSAVAAGHYTTAATTASTTATHTDLLLYSVHIVVRDDTFQQHSAAAAIVWCVAVCL